MAGKKGLIVSTEISDNEAEKLLRRVAQGEQVTTEERLKVMQDILAFSPRDW